MVKWIIDKRRIIFVVLIAVVAIFLIPRLKSMGPEEILEFTSGSPWSVLIILLAIYFIKAVVMVIPIVALYVSAGIIYPPAAAIGVTYLGLFLEITVGYFLGRRIGRDKVEELVKKNKKAKSILDFNSKNDATNCFIMRLLPIPLDMSSMFFGAAGTSYLSYAVFSLLGLTAGMVPWVLAGNAIENPLSMAFIMPFIVSLAISTAAFLFMRLIRKNIKSRNGDKS